MITQSFADAVVAAEKLIREAPHVRTERDVAEGMDYLAGLVRAAVAAAWGHERDHPFLVRTPTQHSKFGLDNPDTMYFSARLRGGVEYVVSGRRGTTTDLSFQVLGGNYTPEGVPESLAAFDDRVIEIGADGSYELRFGPPRDDAPANYVPIASSASTLAIREVFSDWDETPGTIRIVRADAVGTAPTPGDEAFLAKRFEAAAKGLLTQVKTFLAFPEWFYLNLPVNTMTEPRLTPGGLATQYSSVGHFDLRPDQAMIVTVPVSDAPYQGFQLGTMWYVSMDYINHQTSLTAHQARHDPDGMMRFVVSEQDPGVANWLECTGHDRGYLQIRWQRTSREFAAADGPAVEVVPFTEIASRLPHYADARVTPEQWRERIAARQVAVANRMLG